MKPRISVTPLRSIAALLFCALLVPASAQLLIGINISNNTTGDRAIDAGSETFGLSIAGYGDTTQGHWNNIAYSTTTATSSITGTSLVDQNNTTQALAYTLNRSGGSNVSNAAWNNTPWAAGFTEYTTTGGTTRISITSGLSDVFSTANGYAGYYVVAYVGGFASQALNLNLIGSTDGAMTANRVDYYFQSVNPITSYVTTQITNSTNSGDSLNPAGNYAVFGSLASPLTSDAYYVTLNNIAATGAGGILGGVQIVGVPIPEPSTYAALAGFAALLGVMLKRRRSAKKMAVAA